MKLNQHTFNGHTKINKTGLSASENLENMGFQGKRTLNLCVWYISLKGTTPINYFLRLRIVIDIQI